MTSLPLPLLDYKRYGRQMILDGFGLAGQLFEALLALAYSLKFEQVKSDLAKVLLSLSGLVGLVVQYFSTLQQLV